MTALCNNIYVSFYAQLINFTYCAIVVNNYIIAHVINGYSNTH